MKLQANEEVNDYMICAETAAASLRWADEVVSHSLLVSMVIKALPVEYKPLHHLFRMLWHQACSQTV